MNLYGKKYSEIVIDKKLSSKKIIQEGTQVFFNLILSLGFQRDQQFENYISPFFEIETISKQELLFDTESINKNIYLILDGVIEYYSKINNQEMTIILLNNGNICANSNSILRNVESNYYARAIKNTMLLKLNTLAMDNLLNSPYANSVMKFIDFMRFKHEKYMTDFFLITKMPAIVKTEKVLGEYYEIFKNVPQGKISDLLGIKPETFSRVKKQSLSQLA